MSRLPHPSTCIMCVRFSRGLCFKRVSKARLCFSTMRAMAPGSPRLWTTVESLWVGEVAMGDGEAVEADVGDQSFRVVELCLPPKVPTCCMLSL